MNDAETLSRLNLNEKPKKETPSTAQQDPILDSSIDLFMLDPLGGGFSRKPNNWPPKNYLTERIAPIEPFVQPSTRFNLPEYGCDF